MLTFHPSKAKPGSELPAKKNLPSPPCAAADPQKSSQGEGMLSSSQNHCLAELSLFAHPRRCELSAGALLSLKGRVCPKEGHAFFPWEYLQQRE